jgi:hypothetical protein
MWNVIQEILFCPVHGVLRWWPMIAPAIVSGAIYARGLWVTRKLRDQRKED